MPRERKSASAVDYASAPAKRGRCERKRRLAVDGRWVGSLLACAGCVWSQQVEVLELAGDDNAVARALFLKRAEVVRKWELHVAPCEHGLEYLLDRLLSVNRVGAGLTPAPPTPPDVRVRIRRFAWHPGNGGRAR